MAGNVLEFTDSNFQAEVLGSETPVMVDFWAEWCGPCKMMLPTINKVADSYVGRVKVGKLNTDTAQQIAAKYGITAIPTVILFKGGQEVSRLVGLKQERDFAQALDSLTK